ncbi:DEAD/DEAH box helicase [Candidatus Roizmanbacteria bacterium]|nr:DEAD/DEAH box helicase [Candidatus Roizmanbacteria bacterium]
MYTPNRSSSYQNSRPNRFSHQRGAPRRPVTLDPRLFINAAQEQPTEEVVIKHMFTDFKFAPLLERNVLKKGYAKPTPIQDQTILPALEGHDVLGIANTGTGKTAAFSLPIIQQILSSQFGKRALIMAPTRELAEQIKDEIKGLALDTNIRGTLVIGGASMRDQTQSIRRNPHIVIGTPGRLKDLVDRKILDLSTFDILVLDEMDRMLDMGFIKDISYLISFMPEKKQTLFFSATTSRDIDKLIQNFLKNPVKISVKRRDTAVHVEQNVVRVIDGREKMTKLNEILSKQELKKVLIFGRTKAGVDRITHNLYQSGHRVGAIHGDKPQSNRQRVIRMFREDVISILVATDVAARGLDIANVTHVINYDAPATYEDYIHRIGRTGRADHKGQAITFVEGR